MKGYLFFAIIYTVYSIQITSTASTTTTIKPYIKNSPTTSSKPSPSVNVNKYKISPTSYPSAKPSFKPSQIASASNAKVSVSPNPIIYKTKLYSEHKILTSSVDETMKNSIPEKEIKKNGIKKDAKINYKFIIIFFAFIFIVIGYSIYKCINIIRLTKPKKVENQLPFYNNNLSNNNIYYLQPHSPKNDQCYKRSSSLSSLSNNESF